MPKQNQIYKQKYIKYKNKYLNLQQLGSGFATAQLYFYANIIKNENVYNIINNDKILKKQVGFEENALVCYENKFHRNANSSDRRRY